MGRRQKGTIQRAIKDTLRSIHNRERRVRSLFAALKETQGTDPVANDLLSRIKTQEKAIAKLRERLRGMKRAKQNVDKQSRAEPRQKLRILAVERETTQELRRQKEVLGGMRNSSIVLDRRPHTADSHDLFISHAWEDKEDFVEPLARALISRGLSVWYDKFSLKVGDSLRESIDRGLATARYGLVILSTHFFAKAWTRYELNGLISREMEGRKVILPVWHRITRDEVLKFSPSLVDKVALNSAVLGIEEIAQQLAEAIRDA